MIDQDREMCVDGGVEAKDPWKEFSLDHASRSEARSSTLSARRPEARADGCGRQTPIVIPLR
jgi:hypothetical protein